MLMLFGLVLTIIVYGIAKIIYQRSAMLLLSPLIVCPVILITLLTILQISFKAYDQGGHLLSLMLQPATVAFAVPMYRYRAIIRNYLAELIISVTGGAIVAIFTSVSAAELMGLDSQIATSLAPRSITTPMAINVAQVLGGDPSMTAVFVIATGVLGVLLTSSALKWGAIKRPVTRGMMFGITAHGTGTSKAYEMGVLEGAVASLSMIFMGLITTVAAPLLVPFCFYFWR